MENKIVGHKTVERPFVILAAAVVLLTAGTAAAATTERVSVASDGVQANSSSIRPSISAAGRFVAFKSTASNLVPGDTNGTGDIFVHDRGAPGLPGDTNGDCMVNILDLLYVRNRLGLAPASVDNGSADLNGDGAINILDLILVRNKLGATCE